MCQRNLLPDFEELCRAYLTARQDERHEEGDLLVLELIDQCVRNAAGGELGKYYLQLEQENVGNPKLLDFVRLRTGHILRQEKEMKQSRLSRLLSDPRMIFRVLERVYCKAVVSLLPTAFRTQNVSFTSVGEKHAWLYDFHTVERLLSQAGFSEVRCFTASISGIIHFPFVPLDLCDDGTPRKGMESMYVEAIKA
jgi:hypothetical protein